MKLFMLTPGWMWKKLRFDLKPKGSVSTMVEPRQEVLFSSVNIPTVFPQLPERKEG